MSKRGTKRYKRYLQLETPRLDVGDLLHLIWLRLRVAVSRESRSRVFCRTFHTHSHSHPHVEWDKQEAVISGAGLSHCMTFGFSHDE